MKEKHKNHVTKPVQTEGNLALLWSVGRKKNSTQLCFLKKKTTTTNRAEVAT